METTYDEASLLQEIVSELREIKTKLGNVTASNEKLLPEIEVAEMLGIRRQTLGAWRHQGKGPEYIKLGASVRYRRDAVERYLREGTVKA